MLSFKKLIIPAAVAVALLVAACGGSSYSSSSPPASASPSVNQTTSGSQPAVAITTASGSLGRYLTGASGRALYIWVADGNSMSSCSGACAAAWPPLTAGTLPKVMGGASAADLSLIARSDGTKQVAYKGRPLYYYAGDATAGMTNGQGSDQFGAKWWLLSPRGVKISGASSASTVATSAGGGSSGGGW